MTTSTIWALIGLLVSAAVASAQLTCNGRFEVSYPGLGPVTAVGDVVTMRLAFGAGPVLGGLAFFTNNAALELACDADFPIIPCVAEPGTVTYLGDATLTTDCTTCVNLAGGLPGVPAPCAWTSNLPGGGNVPNDVLFELPNVFLRVPAETAVPFCHLDAQVQKLAESTDSTPNLLEQNAGYLASAVPNCPACLAVCDNFVLASTVTQSSALLAAPAGVDVQCRETPRRAASRPDAIVSVSDLLGADPAVTVARSRDLCAPAAVNGRNPGAPGDPVHFVKYALDGVNPALFAQPDALQVHTLLGTFTVDVGAPQQLLVPTAKGLGVVPPALPPNVANHYLCHRVDRARPSVRGTPLLVADQFAAFDTKLVAPRLLCLAAAKQQEPVPFPASHLLCFETNPEEPGTKQTVTILNQFGTDTVPLTEVTQLCVAATL